MTNKAQFRDRAYGSYSSAFKSSLTTSVALDTNAAKRYRSYLASQLGPWLATVDRQGPVVDLGCGDGMLLRVFSELGFTDLSGVDGSPEMVEKCRAHFPKVEHGDLVGYLKATDRTFQVIALFDVIEHFTREEGLDLLDMVKGKLRPGGLLLLQLPNGDSPFAGAVFNNDLTHETLYTKNSLSHALRMAGFGDLRFQEHGPIATDARSSLRWLAWRCVRLLIKACHLAETGGVSSSIYTRVMRAVAQSA
jgi:SAM-dependent methyltransferase